MNPVGNRPFLDINHYARIQSFALVLAGRSLTLDHLEVPNFQSWITVKTFNFKRKMLIYIYFY